MQQALSKKQFKLETDSIIPALQPNHLSPSERRRSFLVLGIQHHPQHVRLEKEKLASTL